MKNFNSIPIFILAILTVVFSCENAGTTNEAEDQETTQAAEKQNAEQIKQIIQNKNEKLERWYKEGKIDSAATVFAEDVVQMPPNSPALRGIDDFKKEWKRLVQEGTWLFDLNAQEVRHSGDLAMELGKYTLDFNPDEDSKIPSFSDKGNYVVLWEKRNGEWEIVWDAPVSEQPLPDMVMEHEKEQE
ncbi:MAG: YybH family protein [Candidatus Cyclobacteriaceae bacterium M2_1C_046]